MNSRKFKHNFDFRQTKMEYAKKHQFQDLPTILDEPQPASRPSVSLQEETIRQQGILHDINNLERMLILGEMALNDFPSFERMMALPSFLEKENIQVKAR